MFSFVFPVPMLDHVCVDTHSIQAFGDGDQGEEIHLLQLRGYHGQAGL